MARRKTYKQLVKRNQVRAKHVKGNGDVLFKGFQCLNSECTQYIFVRKAEIEAEFKIICPACSFELVSGGETSFFDFDLVDKRSGEVLNSGQFTVDHDSYIREAHEYKYCLYCNALKAAELFDRHRPRQSGRQGECRLCKLQYNSINNPERLTEQHREASQTRRLYNLLAGESEGIDVNAIFSKFDGKCFNCGKRLMMKDDGTGDFQIDHTLPVMLLWPVITSNATLLCKPCNLAKREKWPSNFYEAVRLKELAVLTGIDYDLLTGGPVLNERAVAKLLSDVDGFLKEWIPYPARIKQIRHLIKRMRGVDIRDLATNWPQSLGT